MGNVPFTVYFNFEATTGDNVFQNPEMFVISYCQIYAFHPALNLDKIVIFRREKQRETERETERERSVLEEFLHYDLDDGFFNYD